MDRSTTRLPRIRDVLRTRFGLPSRYFHSFLCELEDRVPSTHVFDVDDPLLTEVQDEIQATGFHPHYGQEYRRVETSYWGPALSILRARSETIGTGIACLDVGPGHGSLLVFAARLGWRAYAVDISPEFLSPVLIERYRIQFHSGNIESGTIPWTERFDLILMTEVLEHFHFNPLPTLRKLRESLAERGLLVLTTPNRYCGWGDAKVRGPYWQLPPFRSGYEIIDPMGTHVKIYDRFELGQLMNDAGFEAEVSEHRRRGWRRGHLVVLARKATDNQGDSVERSGSRVLNGKT